MKVRLKHDHVHAGEEHATGAVLNLDKATAQWLLDMGRAELVQEKKEPKKSTPGE